MMNTDKPTILVVDDTPQNIDVLKGILGDDYRIIAAINGQIALDIIGHQRPDLILLDVMMPGIDGYEVCRRLKAEPTTAAIPVIFVTAKADVTDEELGFQLGAVDYITKPVSPPIVLQRVATHLALYSQARHLESLVKLRTSELEETRFQIIRRLARAGEFKDNETGLHVIRMSWYSRFLAEQIGESEQWCELLYNAAPMHDIGKIGIPDHILLKPGKLDEHEWKIMQQHVDYGVEIIGDHDSPLLCLAKQIAEYHHEKWDGTGYPKHVAGENIPLGARIVAIADVFDALSSERPYKSAWPEEKVLALLREEAGKQFDPNLIEPFCKCLPKIRQIQQQYAD